MLSFEGGCDSPLVFWLVLSIKMFIRCIIFLLVILGAGGIDSHDSLLSARPMAQSGGVAFSSDSKGQRESQAVYLCCSLTIRWELWEASELFMAEGMS